MEVRDQITLSVLALVFFGSVFNQLPVIAWHTLIARLDPSGFLPYYGFFGPKPAFAGVHIVYRDKDPSCWSCWAEIDVPPTNGWRWIWNPARHERKALHDLVNGLAFLIAESRGQTPIVLSNCHLALVAWVLAQPRILAASQFRQFALVEATGHGAQRKVQPVFTSEIFSID